MRLIASIFLFAWLCGYVYGHTKDHTKSWSSAIITGPLSCDQKLRFYLQPQLNLIDSKYKFHTALLYFGMGYQITDKSTFWLLGGYHRIRGASGRYESRYTLRQQLDYQIFDSDALQLSSRTRFETRKNGSDRQLNLRLRERLTLRIPFVCWEDHSFVVFDEPFIYFNHPKWVNSNTFLAQNHLFIGIGTVINKAVNFDFGYLNQYHMREPDEMNHVIFLQFHVSVA